MRGRGEKCAHCDQPRQSSSGYCLECYREYTRKRQAKCKEKRAAAGLRTYPYVARQKHGCTNEPWFRSYEAMRRRSSGKHPSRCYAHVTLCEEWRDPVVFGEWAWRNGFAPGLSIDRINSTLGYFPENCRWISKSENTRESHRTSPRRHDERGRFIGASP